MKRARPEETLMNGEKKGEEGMRMEERKKITRSRGGRNLTLEDKAQ